MRRGGGGAAADLICPAGGSHSLIRGAPYRGMTRREKEHMTKSKKVFQNVVSIEQALFSASRWYLTLACGHSIARFERKQPTVQRACCAVCMAAEPPLFPVAGQEQKPG